MFAAQTEFSQLHQRLQKTEGSRILALIGNRALTKQPGRHPRKFLMIVAGNTQESPGPDDPPQDPSPHTFTSRSHPRRSYTTTPARYYSCPRFSFTTSN
jgi:hypothetical protein